MCEDMVREAESKKESETAEEQRRRVTIVNSCAHEGWKIENPFSQGPSKSCSKATFPPKVPGTLSPRDYFSRN